MLRSTRDNPTCVLIYCWGSRVFRLICYFVVEDRFDRVELYNELRCMPFLYRKNSSAEIHVGVPNNKYIVSLLITYYIATI